MRDRRPSIAILQSFLILYRMYNTSYNEKMMLLFTRFTKIPLKSLKMHRCKSTKFLLTNCWFITVNNANSKEEF